MCLTLNRTTGEVLRLSHDEHHAFWQWAVIETLRLAGLRIEELTELSQVSVRNYNVVRVRLLKGGIRKEEVAIE